MDFEQIYREYFKDVFLYVRSLTTQEGLAEEITQETFTKALKAIDSYDGKKILEPGFLPLQKIAFIPIADSKSTMWNTNCRRTVQMIFPV